MNFNRTNVMLALASVLITTILSVILLEVLVRQYYPYWTPSMALNYSPAVFSRHVLPAKEHEPKKNTIPPKYFHINEHGYRGDSFSADKKGNTTRIIVYGGSQVFDSRVSTGKDWPTIAEKHLRKNGFENVEVINAGIPGHSSADAVGRLFAEGHLLDPDIVVLCNTWNDLKYFHTETSLLRHLDPYKKYRDEVRYYQNSLDRFLGEYSQFYVRLRNDYFQWKYSLGSEGQKTQSVADPSISDKALDQFEMNIETFINVARSAEAAPVLMTQPSLIPLKKDQSSDRKVKYHFTNLTPEQTREAFRKATDIIRTKASVMNVPLFDGYSFMADRPDEFNDHVHFNERGSKSMGEFLSREIERVLSERPTSHTPN